MHFLKPSSFIIFGVMWVLRSPAKQIEELLKMEEKYISSLKKFTVPGY